MKNPPPPALRFDHGTPVATRALGGLIQNHFSHGRLAATLAHHGGITCVNFAGPQHLDALRMFHGDTTTAWNKVFRASLCIDGDRYYPVLQNTEVYPFGLRSRGRIAGVEYVYEFVLLPDAIVQRMKIVANPRKRKVGMEILHQEAVAAVELPRREWTDMAFHPRANAVVTCCTDRNPGVYRGDDSLAQRGYGLALRESEHSEVWVAIGSQHPMRARRGYHRRSKHYLDCDMPPGRDGAFFMAFAGDRRKLDRRLADLRRDVHVECDALFDDYHRRLDLHPAIRTGSPVLDSAFLQYPEMVHASKIPDRPGAVKATMAGYFVWGWDCMMLLFSTALANEPDYSASILRFFQSVRHPRLGLPHAFTTSFQPKLKGPIPSQCQFILGLYHLVSSTGDLEVAREVWPTCQFILDRCRRDVVGDTGLVAGHALWPDFPEAMDEDGDDVSSLNNSFVYQALRCLEYIALELGKPAVARECAAWAARLRRSFIKYLFDDAKGYFISSCSSRTLKPRRHYPAQAVFWVTPFARELVAHAPGRIAAFMDEHLRSKRCLLTLPHWDAAWMADGNQLGSSFPAADAFYLGVHKLVGDARALDLWLGDVEWFWRFLTAPEAFTPEAENEDDLGPDNVGCKQTQALTTWYAAAHHALAGLDFDHEGLTFTPWGARPVEIRRMLMRGRYVDVKLTGAGRHVRSITLNGRKLPAGLHKIPWALLRRRPARLVFQRTNTPPPHPVVVRADGLKIRVTACEGRRLAFTVSGVVTGEVAVQASPGANVRVNGRAFDSVFEPATRTVIIPFANEGPLKVEVESL